MSDDNVAPIKKKERLPKPVTIAIIGALTTALVAYTAYGVARNDLVIPMSLQRSSDYFRRTDYIHFSGFGLFVVAACLMVIAAAFAHLILRQVRAAQGEKIKVASIDFAALCALMMITAMCIAKKLSSF